jgi:hypothetical protein
MPDQSLNRRQADVHLVPHERWLTNHVIAATPPETSCRRRLPADRSS